MRDRIHHWKRPAFIAGLCLVCIPVYSQFDTPSGGGRKVILAGGVVAGYLADPAGGPTDAMADAQVAVPQGLLTLEGNPAACGSDRKMGMRGIFPILLWTGTISISPSARAGHCQESSRWPGACGLRRVPTDATGPRH